MTDDQIIANAKEFHTPDLIFLTQDEWEEYVDNNRVMFIEDFRFLEGMTTALAGRLVG